MDVLARSAWKTKGKPDQNAHLKGALLFFLVDITTSSQKTNMVKFLELHVTLIYHPKKMYKQDFYMKIFVRVFLRDWSEVADGHICIC